MANWSFMQQTGHEDIGKWFTPQLRPGHRNLKHRQSVQVYLELLSVTSWWITGWRPGSVVLSIQYTRSETRAWWRWENVAESIRVHSTWRHQLLCDLMMSWQPAYCRWLSGERCPVTTIQCLWRQYLRSEVKNGFHHVCPAFLFNFDWSFHIKYASSLSSYSQVSIRTTKWVYMC